MDQRIIDFINQNKVLSICCLGDDNKPYCFSCFYAFDQKTSLMYFKSSSQSYHAKMIVHNPIIAGTILPDKIELLTLKGIQFTGKILDEQLAGAVEPESYYHKKFPFAVAMPGHVWCIEPEMIKMTDNTNLFGKKIVWNKNRDVPIN